MDTSVKRSAITVLYNQAAAVTSADNLDKVVSVLTFTLQWNNSENLTCEERK